MPSSRMVRLWLIFSQAATIAVAALFVVSTFRPEWLPSRAGAQIPLSITQPSSAGPMQVAARTGPAPASYYDAVQRATPSVVNIFTSKEVRAPRHPLLNDPIFRRFFGDQLPDEAQRAASLGSGVIVSGSGYVLTNHHVVEAADEIEVALADGKRLLAKVVGNDPETDLAVLRLDAENLPAISFGSSETLRVGDVVLAIGNPFGVGQTVTSGIVSALGRTGLGINTFENFIQTDAAINPGNSGGARLDGDRLRHPRIDRQDGARADRQERQRHARLDRRRSAGDHAAGRRILQARRHSRRAHRRRAARRARRQGRHQAGRRPARGAGQAGRRSRGDAEPHRRSRSGLGGDDESEAPGPGRGRQRHRRPASQAAGAAGVKSPRIRSLPLS